MLSSVFVWCLALALALPKVKALVDFAEGWFDPKQADLWELRAVVVAFRRGRTPLLRVYTFEMCILQPKKRRDTETASPAAERKKERERER